MRLVPEMKGERSTAVALRLLVQITDLYGEHLDLYVEIKMN